MNPPSFGSVCPLDGRLLTPVDWMVSEDVAPAIRASRSAQRDWAALSLKVRSKSIQRLAKRILDHREEILDIMGDEMGRGRADSLLSELTVVMNYAKGAAAVAKQALKSEKVKLSPIEFPGKKAVIEAVPRGVVGIIAPWNYPLMQCYRPMFHALMAGNGVVLKPSEHTPRTGAWLVAQCDAVLPVGLVAVLLGDGAMGAALVESEIDALIFTGSCATGRKVAARAGERLLPCSVELGGTDAAIVLADCDLDRTVMGITHWSMHNAGQDCSSIERVYVEEAIADVFVARLAAVASRLRVAGQSSEPDIGPLQNAAQLAIVNRLVQGAVTSGATLVCGGKATGAGYGYEPTILDHCTQDMEVVYEETFGPVLAIIRVNQAVDAIRLVNAVDYGLNGSVWTRNRQLGETIARQLEVGIALVNNHSFTGVVPQIPWTGVKGTGTGIAASRHSYGSYVRRRTVVVDRSKKPEVFWFPADADLLALGHAVADLSMGAFGKIATLLPLLGKRTKTIQSLAQTKALSDGSGS